MGVRRPPGFATLTAMEDEKPDTRHLVLKPKVVARTDPVLRPDDPDAISVQAIHQQNMEAEARRLALQAEGAAAPFAPEPESPLPPGFKRTQVDAVSPPAPAGDEEAIAVPDILRENLVADQASGWGALPDRPLRKSRRLRDYLLIVLPVNLGIMGMAWLSHNPAVLIFGTAAAVVLATTLGWIMFFVMDKY